MLCSRGRRPPCLLRWLRPERHHWDSRFIAPRPSAIRQSRSVVSLPCLHRLAPEGQYRGMPPGSSADPLSHLWTFYKWFVLTTPSFGVGVLLIALAAVTGEGWIYVLTFLPAIGMVYCGVRMIREFPAAWRQMWAVRAERKKSRSGCLHAKVA